MSNRPEKTSTELLEIIEAIAKESFGGRFMVIALDGKYRVGFGIPASRIDYRRVPDFSTLHAALINAIQTKPEFTPPTPYRYDFEGTPAKNEYQNLGDRTIKITLTQGHYCLADSEDFETLRHFRWCAVKTKGLYATACVSTNGKQTNILMHRLIMNAPAGAKVDHREHDTLDNRKANLRLATSAQNNQNQQRRSDNKTGFKGVSFNKNAQKFYAGIRIDGKSKHLGSFNTAKEAAVAYNAAAIAAFGEFACLNNFVNSFGCDDGLYLKPFSEPTEIVRGLDFSANFR